MSQSAALPQDLEHLADSLTGCADTLHARLLRSVRRPAGPALTQEAAQALFEQEVALRQQANQLYLHAASLAPLGLAGACAELLALAARARGVMAELAHTQQLIGIGSDLLAAAAAIAAGRPDHLPTPLKSLKARLATL